jgi:hypothetical protein
MQQWPSSRLIHIGCGLIAFLFATRQFKNFKDIFGSFDRFWSDESVGTVSQNYAEMFSIDASVGSMSKGSKENDQNDHIINYASVIALGLNGMSGPELLGRLDDMMTSKMDVFELEGYFGCNEIFGKAIRPTPSKSAWMTMRTTYHEMVGPEKSTIAPLSATEDGWYVPYEVKEAPFKGRGVFATTKISKGTLIYDPTRQLARFVDGKSFRSFLALLPNNLACEAMQLHYLDYFGGAKDEPAGEKKGVYYICAELDEGGLTNEPNWSDKEINAGCNPELAKGYPDGCENLDFATRDIEAGEELVCNYDELGWGHMHPLW